MADLRVELDGKPYSLDPDSITSREYKSIRAHTGYSMNKFWEAVQRMGESTDVEVIDVLHWLFRKRAGEASDLFTDDEYSPAHFLMSLVSLNALDEAVAEDPKAESSTTPTSSEPTNT